MYVTRDNPKPPSRSGAKLKVQLRDKQDSSRVAESEHAFEQQTSLLSKEMLRRKYSVENCPRNDPRNARCIS